MKILVEVKPNSAQNKVEHISGNVYQAKVTAPAQDGRANRTLIGLLAAYFDVAKSRIEIKTGKTAKTKLVIISG